MKSVLIVDESPLFREYLRDRLEENGIEVGTGIKAMDSIYKMRMIAPDLIIIDYDLGGEQGFMEVLKAKKADPNAAKAPIIVIAKKIEQKQLVALIPFGVIKVFTKPVKIDALFAALSETLGVKLTIDQSPSIVEAHINERILFIEIAQGFNRDKLDLLRFKINELLEIYDIKIPRVIIMFSDMKMGFSDTVNLHKLLGIVLQATRAKLSNIRILTKEDFVRKFIHGQKEYHGIGVVTNLQYAMDGLIGGMDSDADDERKAELLGDKLLQAKIGDEQEAVALKFDAEAKNISFEIMKDSLQNLRVAVIDNDFIIQQLIKKIFEKNGAVVSVFSDGEEFLNVVDKKEFDLAFLDLMLPRVDGFAVLQALQARNISYPIIVLSAVSQRETMIRAIQMGVKSYLIKPLKSEDIFRKAVEILKANY